MLTVDIVIPARDEAAALPGVLAAIPRAGEGWRVRHVVVADNASRDATADVARAGGAQVVHVARPGYGRACLGALAEIRRDPPHTVVFLDADHSDDPRELPAILAPIVAASADLVIGSRLLGEHEPGALTSVQAVGNALAGGLLRAFWGVRATDLGPFRAIRWEALEALRMRDPDFGWTAEMQARAARARLRTVEVPVRYRRRRAGRSKIAGTFSGSVRAGLKILFTIARVRLGA